MKKQFFILLFFFVSFFSNLIFSQYTENDSLLVRTTYLREFNKNIIHEYLISNEISKVNAALLSISHSEDTTFLDSIIKLDFNKYGTLLSFTLGQLGESKTSEQFFLNKLSDSSNQCILPIYESIGKVGDSLTLDYLLKKVANREIKSFGFPYSIVDFFFRGIKNSMSDEFLAKQLKLNLDDEQLFQTLFALYRIGTSEDIINDIKKIIETSKNDSVIVYALGNLRKAKSFPDDIKLLNKLSQNKSWRIRTEFANSACYFNFRTKEEISIYLSLLNDINPNVSRTTAKAIKNIQYTQDKTWFKSVLEEFLMNPNLTTNAKGELLISYQNLFNIKVEDLFNEYEDIVESKFLFGILEDYVSEWEFNFDYLNDKITESNEVELLDLLPAYLALQNKYLNNKEYATNLFTALNSNMPSSVSIIADGIKTPMIHKYKEVLQEIILNQIFENKDNPKFVETIISLMNLAYKVDRIFYDSTIDMLSNSTIYSIKKFVSEKQGLSFNIPKDEFLFTRLWNSAFKFKFAEVVTIKGNFTIKLKPDFAPLTCGNFISLAQSEYYNDIIFHRVVPNFVIQTGDTTDTGWGGPGYEIVSEFSPLPFERSAVGMASIGKDTEGSQWFVMHSVFPHLNGRYTNWGNIIKGMDVVDSIDEGDTILNVRLRNYLLN